MYIGELIEKAKETKDEKVIEQIIKYYEPSFLNKIEKNYGNDYVDKAKKELPILIKYYFEKNIKIYLWEFLRKKTKCIYTNLNYNEVFEKDFQFIIDHYIDKLYKILLTINQTNILTEEQLYKLAVFDINNIYNKYIKTEKKSSVSMFFNMSINRNVKLYKDESFFLISYVRKIGVTEEIKVYFFNKYLYLLKEFNTVSLDDYKAIIDELLNEVRTLKSNTRALSEAKLLKRMKSCSKREEKALKDKSVKELDNLKSGKSFDYEFLKNYYLYIKELVFERFKDKVYISPDELKKEIDDMYERYFDVALGYIANRNGKPGHTLSQYINNRIRDGLEKVKKSNNTLFVDSEIKKNIDDNLYLVGRYAIKYAGSCPRKVLESKLEAKYYDAVGTYYRKKRKTTLEDYLKGSLRDEAKNIVFNYVDGSIPMDSVKKLK